MSGHWLAIEGEAEHAVPLRQVILSSSPAPGSSMRQLVHVDASGPELWSRRLVDHIRAEVQLLDPAAALRLAENDEASLSQLSVDAAMLHLRSCWPELAVEMFLLQRACVYVRGPDFHSATSAANLGVVVLGVEATQSLDGALEHLLHEAGHSALYLGEPYEQYLENPGDPASHPLREDVRPLYGVLHAAMATSRVALGLERLRPLWTDHPGIEERYLDNRAAVNQILETLSELARWTPQGELLFRSLTDAVES